LLRSGSVICASYESRRRDFRRLKPWLACIEPQPVNYRREDDRGRDQREAETPPARPLRRQGKDSCHWRTPSPRPSMQRDLLPNVPLWLNSSTFLQARKCKLRLSNTSLRDSWRPQRNVRAHVTDQAWTLNHFDLIVCMEAACDVWTSIRRGAYAEPQAIPAPAPRRPASRPRHIWPIRWRRIERRHCRRKR
jgi:hypothetical protein